MTDQPLLVTRSTNHGYLVAYRAMWKEKNGTDDRNRSWIEQDEDLAPLRGDSRFRRLMEEM